MEITPAPFNFLDAHVGQRVTSPHFGAGTVVSWDSSWVVVNFGRPGLEAQRVSPFGLTLDPTPEAPAPRPVADHERRSRQAKATALATVLAGAAVKPEDVRHLTPLEWRQTAQIATLKNLLGPGRTVHVPHSDATVRAVGMALRGMAAAARVEPARRPSDAPGYRRTMAAIAPYPETTEADLFAPFAQADRR